MFKILSRGSDCTTKVPSISAYCLKKWTNNFSSKKLGRGGYGQVFLGEVKSLKASFHVAVKVFHKDKLIEFFPNKDDEDLFKDEYKKITDSVKREIKILSDFRHKNIVKLLVSLFSKSQEK